MLSRDRIEEIAASYLVKNKYPIVIPGKVVLSNDENDPESREFLEKNSIARVSFKSKYLNDPEHELEPGVYIVYVNILTGEVDMPPHMV